MHDDINIKIELFRLFGLIKENISNEDFIKSIHTELEDNKYRDALTDKLIEYNDEIVSIELVGECPTVDITVTGDSLFYANNILTKNSMGVIHVLDAYWALIRTEELDEMNQCLYSMLKNRFGKNTGSCVIGIDYNKMRVLNVDKQQNQTKQHHPEVTEIPPWVAGSSKFDKYSNIVM